MTHRIISGIALVGALAAHPALAHHGPSVLGSVRIGDPVTVGGTMLQPGTYEIRLTGEHLPAMAGQSENAEQAVDIVKDGVVVAHDAATVLEGVTAPVGTSGGSGPRARVERLKGDEFLRVSFYKDSDRYLIHLPLAH
jgi:hypothetical protein